MEILTEEEERARPAGKRRDDPNQNPFLEEPKQVKYLMFIIFY